MEPTRVYSGPWIFDGTEYHRAAVDRSETEHGACLHPRVDVRHAESHDRVHTYKLAPGAEDPALPTLKQARAEAEKGRDEWERGKRSLYPCLPKVREELFRPPAREIFKQEWDEAATRPRNEALEKHGADIEAEIMERSRADHDRDTDIDR